MDLRDVVLLISSYHQFIFSTGNITAPGHNEHAGRLVGFGGPRQTAAPSGNDEKSSGESRHRMSDLLTMPGLFCCLEVSDARTKEG